MKIPTIKRRKWHGSYRWQATDKDGLQVAYLIKPTPDGTDHWMILWDSGPGFILGPRRRPPADWASTLRRIEPGKKGRKG